MTAPCKLDNFYPQLLFSFSPSPLTYRPVWIIAYYLSICLRFLSSYCWLPLPELRIRKIGVLGPYGARHTSSYPPCPQCFLSLSNREWPVLSVWWKLPLCHFLSCSSADIFVFLLSLVAWPSWWIKFVGEINKNSGSHFLRYYISIYKIRSPCILLTLMVLLFADSLGWEASSLQCMVRLWRVWTALASTLVFQVGGLTQEASYTLGNTIYKIFFCSKINSEFNLNFHGNPRGNTNLSFYVCQLPCFPKHCGLIFFMVFS